ncbi:MAG: hypothetical protein H8Z69_03420 [Nanohaloarchaea archaeon]|nr:hypothetical protein [Candidatus Nanohaloarchaea archaeon]
MPNRFKPSIEEVNAFVAATVAITAAFTAFKGNITVRSVVFYGAVSGLILLSREIGQRTIAQWMEADVELKLSPEGTVLTLLGAGMSFLSSIPVIMLFPITSNFSITSYEHWGKGVDAMWIKREQWFVNAGLVALSILWLGFYSLGISNGAEAVSFFALFQLLPFDYSGIPTGRLDGAVILKHNGFRWILWFALAWISVVPL